MTEPSHHPPPDRPPSDWGQPPGGPPTGRGTSRLGVTLLVVAAVAVIGGAATLLATRGGGDDDGVDAAGDPPAAAPSDDDGDGGVDAGGDPPAVEPSTEEQDYAGAIADSLSRDMAMDDVMAHCVGTVTVEMVGIDVLRGAATVDQLRYGTYESFRDFGVTLDEPQVAELARRYDECGDWMSTLIATWTQAEATSETLACLEQNVSEETLAYIAAVSFLGTQELTDSVEGTSDDVVQRCVPGAGGL